MNARIVICALAALVPLAGWSQDSARKLNASQAVSAIDALANWYECEDCHPSELKAVTAYGATVVPSLIATLNGGLSPATRELLRRRLEERYVALSAENASGIKIGASRDDFVARHLGDFDARYRIRATQALCAIGGKEARAALENAFSKTNRSDGRSAITDCLKTIK